MEAAEGPAVGKANNVRAVVAALETAGLEFIPENGGGGGVRFRQPKGGDFVGNGRMIGSMAADLELIAGGQRKTVLSIFSAAKRSAHCL